jgi:hypothetical protein
MANDLKYEAFFYSTAHDQRMYFSGEAEPLLSDSGFVGSAPGAMLEGTYRVLDGDLFKVESGLPPWVEVAPATGAPAARAADE